MMNGWTLLTAAALTAALAILLLPGFARYAARAVTWGVTFYPVHFWCQGSFLWGMLWPGVIAMVVATTLLVLAMIVIPLQFVVVTLAVGLQHLALGMSAVSDWSVRTMARLCERGKNFAGEDMAHRSARSYVRLRMYREMAREVLERRRSIEG